MRSARTLFAAVVGTLVLCGAAAAAPGASRDVRLAPVTRLPFPDRGYVVHVPDEAELDGRNVVVRENGRRVTGVRVDPLASSGLRFGVVLALDASDSMAGPPAAAAVRAARAFVAHRAPAGEVGVVAFNGGISVLRNPTRDGSALRRTLASPPRLAYGTRINDALIRSLALLRDAKISSGSIVLLSDGADIGSQHSLDEAVAAAKEQRVRVFTVGLRSGAFDAAPLRRIADQTGASYAEAHSASELASVYEALGDQLAGEYLVRYRSVARPNSEVRVDVRVTGMGRAAASYVAPTPSLLPPYHRSLVSRFLLSGSSPLLISLVFGLLICALLLLLARRPKSTVVGRVQTFAPGAPSARPGQAAAAAAVRVATRNRYASGWWAQLERDLELARMTASPRKVVAIALSGTFAITLLALILSAPLLALFGLATPFVARAVIRRKVKAVRAEFAEQFPGSLQVLASALRAGYSFNGALGVVVDNASEPARSELARVMQDDQLGVLPEEAIRRLARRMANRDIEQVALLAELQRTSGGNSAEILDTVVGTIRERAEIRRLVRTLTAQGRMARWILTALPVFLTAFLWLVHPDVMAHFFTSGGGQVALAVATLMVAAGSVLIQRIVDIDV
ncbi:MAG TPA: type II secretion system F family protein [Gaiellaceae bacterium]|nr:type II secretion system F family protein [Gaiellaceae bacterium]